MDKKGKLSTLIFIGIIVLALLGLLIMDYQLEKATDITGAYLGSGTSAYISQNMLTAAVVLGLIVFSLVIFTFGKVRKSRLISTMPLAKINDEIKKIDDQLRGKLS